MLFCPHNQKWVKRAAPRKTGVFVDSYLFIERLREDPPPFHKIRRPEFQQKKFGRKIFASTFLCTWIFARRGQSSKQMVTDTYLATQISHTAFGNDSLSPCTSKSNRSTTQAVIFKRVHFRTPRDKFSTLFEISHHSLKMGSYNGIITVSPKWLYTQDPNILENFLIQVNFSVVR